MDCQLNVTPVSEPLYFQNYIDRGATPDPSRTSLRIVQTDMFGHKAHTIKQTETHTPTLSDLRQIAQREVIEGVELTDDSPVAAASQSRISLLVQKYEGKSSREDSARLEILTQRIRRLSPRVTAYDLNAMTVMVDEIEEVSAGLEDLRREFGLD